MKRLQITLKDTKAIARAVEKVRAFVKKALKEANVRATAAEDKLGAFYAEKDLVNQALALEKIGWANVEFALVKKKEWKEGKPSRLAAMKANAKAEMREEAIAKVVEFGMRFQWSALFFIRKNHLGIDLSRSILPSWRAITLLILKMGQ